MNEEFREPNPYTFAEPVYSPTLFYGREQEMANILSGLQAGLPRGFCVIGGSRMGKSSFLRQIQYHVQRDQRFCDNDSDFVAVLLPLSNVESVSTFWQSLIIKSIEAVSEKTRQPDLWGLAEAVPESGTGHIFCEMFERLKARAPTIQAVLLLDDMDHLLRREQATNVVQEMANAIDQSSLPIGYVFAFSDIVTRVRPSNSSQVWFKIEDIKLKALNESEVERLINEPTGNRVPAQIAARVIEETGGHPALTQFVMNRLYDYSMESISLVQLETVLREAADSIELWTGYFDSTPLVDQKILTMLAAGFSATPKAHPSSDLQGYWDFWDSLERLQLNGIIRRLANTPVAGYGFTGRLFLQYWQQVGILQPTNENRRRKGYGFS